MHVISNCPKCKIDFMYHTSEYGLERDITIVDEFGNNEIISKHICQDCDEVEKKIDSISKRYDLTNHESYVLSVTESWENGEINELHCDGMITIDKEERREDGSLSYQSFRFLTEEEFNARFNKKNNMTIKNIEEIVNNYPTKHKQGFVGREIVSLLKEYNINTKEFYKKLGVNTVGIVDTEVVTYHCDIIKGLRCVLENREQTLEEWD